MLQEENYEKIFGLLEEDNEDATIHQHILTPYLVVMKTSV